VGRGKYRPHKPLPFRMRLWIRQRYRCGICGKQIRKRELFKDHINLDHIVAKSKGGTRDPENMSVVHMACNQLKADSCPCDFYGPEYCTTDIHGGDGDRRRRSSQGVTESEEEGVAVSTTADMG